MARILAFDYGGKRTGVAVTDPSQIIANGLTTVPTGDLFQWIKAYLQYEEVGCIVVGDPKNLDNTPAEIAQETDLFVEKLTKAYPDIQIKRIDERFTSKMAVQTLIDSGIKKMERRNKELVDEVSATIILQSYLESIE